MEAKDLHEQLLALLAKEQESMPADVFLSAFEKAKSEGKVLCIDSQGSYIPLTVGVRNGFIDLNDGELVVRLSEIKWCKMGAPIEEHKVRKAYNEGEDEKRRRGKYNGFHSGSSPKYMCSENKEES